jgi:hypothetical protein
MAFKRGQRIKMLTWFEGLDEPDEEFGTILVVEGKGRLRVEMDSGPYIVWMADTRNTEVIDQDRKNSED